MPNLNSRATCTIELWIEVNLREGHVESLVDDVFYGFWPDYDMSTPIEGSILGKDGTPAYGGWAGRLMKRTEGELYVSYLTQCTFEAGFLKETPNFSIYTLVTSVQQKEDFKKHLELTSKNPPEYDLRGRSPAFNCVSLAVHSLKEFRILPPDFQWLGKLPRPRSLDAALVKYSKSTPEIRRSRATVHPARFQRQEIIS